ncbi:hypothetical protein HPB50_020601 [Hyalomma asiaticum]|uniref:Uncharacterized protein n=1 Tax=Hyalomma asiaticum TaxID=266040 RepID=A0ACB7S293_HYAAI|nr:hypothetical protein HPB50_020601 [Hyalomma asiaticum]
MNRVPTTSNSTHDRPPCGVPYSASFGLWSRHLSKRPVPDQKPSDRPVARSLRVRERETCSDRDSIAMAASKNRRRIGGASGSAFDSDPFVNRRQ